MQEFHSTGKQSAAATNRQVAEPLNYATFAAATISGLGKSRAVFAGSLR